MARFTKRHISATNKPSKNRPTENQAAETQATVTRPTDRGRAAASARTDRAAAPRKPDGVVDVPVALSGKAIATRFWGQAWCRHLESFSDFSNRLPRGRTYLRGGAVRALQADGGAISARVSGSAVYRVNVEIDPLPPTAWAEIKHDCAGEVASLLALLQGQLSDAVMRRVTDRRRGLFPQPGEMRFSCTCPDWADMCKHVAAVLYGIGNALDRQPELLFHLRGVDPQDLLEHGFIPPPVAPGGTLAVPAPGRLADDQLAAIFGIELDFELPDSLDTGPAERAATSASAAVSETVPQPDPRGSAPTGTGVAALRQRLGMSPAAFAKALAVSVSSVYRWETLGEQTIRLQAAIAARLQALQRQASGG